MISPKYIFWRKIQKDFTIVIIQFSCNNLPPTKKGDNIMRKNEYLLSLMRQYKSEHWNSNCLVIWSLINRSSFWAGSVFSFSSWKSFSSLFLFDFRCAFALFAVDSDRISRSPCFKRSQFLFRIVFSTWKKRVSISFSVTCSV